MIFFLAAAAGAFAQPRRVVPPGGNRWALVVGNNNYTEAVRLQKAVNDARGMAAVLRASARNWGGQAYRNYIFAVRCVGEMN
jgi:hypothetical protein